jgi:hypothetical protein
VGHLVQVGDRESILFQYPRDYFDALKDDEIRDKIRGLPS